MDKSSVNTQQTANRRLALLTEDVDNGTIENAWEVEFITNLAELPAEQALTGPQLGKLTEIWERYRG